MTDDADDVDDDERSEAAALAAALDGETSASAPPEDALATALLMRHSGARGELSAERGDAILNDLLHAAAEGRAGARRRGRVVRLWPWAAALAAAAALALVWLRPAPQPQRAAAPEAAAVEVVPRASASLLAAKSTLLRESLSGGTEPGRARRDPEAAARFERELRAYRGELFRALQGAYPDKVGQLDPALRRAR